MKFQINLDCENDYIKRLKIGDTICKHLLLLNSDKSKRIYEMSVERGLNILWGFGIGTYKNPEVNRELQLENIRRMIYKQRCSPFRIVISKEGHMYIDNLHSAIRDILVFGEDVTIGEVPYYLIDTSYGIPVVEGYIHDSVKDIHGAVGCALRRQKYMYDEYIKLGYTIKEFMDENKINRDSVNLPNSKYEDYIKAVKNYKDTYKIG